MGNETKKKLRFFVSLHKERSWLEAMAKEGWFLDNITLGIFYTFKHGVPKNMMYEADRFNLPKKPTLEEIRHKEFFMDTAHELGWSEVTHDESMTYYFCKEYKEGDINELYNDEESRKQRGRKFTVFYYQNAKQLIFWTVIVMLVDFFVMLCQMLCQYVEPQSKLSLEWYHCFAMIYAVLGNLGALFDWKLAKITESELALSREEWNKRQENTRCRRKLILTIRSLRRFLIQQEKEGWILADASAMKYYFTKREDQHQIYTMDSKWLTNKRRKEQCQTVFKDNKDWQGISNDWQVQSLKDAEAKGWKFVCALENKAVIYRGDAGKTEPLNKAKYDNSLRGVSLIGDYGLIILVSGLIGGIFGFVTAILSL